METMTGRERMMSTLRNKQADRVPAAPDISYMIPMHLTGKPFWEIEVNENPPLWRAYVDAIKYFGTDGWFIYGAMDFKVKNPLTIDREIVRKTEDLWQYRTTYHTPEGDLTRLTVSPRADSSTDIEKVIKDFKEDFKKVKYLFQDIIGYDDTNFKLQKKELGELGIMANSFGAPGLHVFVSLFNGSLEAATYAYYDYPELFRELCELYEKTILKQVEMTIEAGTDSICTGGSGSITLQSPDLWREMSLPTIRKISRMCKEADVISGIHSCGKEKYLVETVAEETDINYVNPLEIAPMGDCVLAECKKKVGHKIALMGNLHTTSVMLNGKVTDVRRESLKAIRDAGMNGGFVLSTGDQCGRETPFENLFEMLRVAKEFGVYPLDMDRIESEINRLERL